jgi:hypothetical protein
MKTNFKIKLVCSVLLVFLFEINLNAQSDNELNLGRVYPGEIDYAGFNLDQDATISISGNAASIERWGNNLVFYGWIIESESRKVVWNLLDAYESEFFHGEGEFSFEAELKLKKGTYEVYYTGVYGNARSYYSNDFSDLVKDVFKAIIYNHDDDEYYNKSKNHIKVTCNTKGFAVTNGKEYIDKILKKSIASFVRVGNNESESKKFSLSKDTKIYIYCQGERDGHEFYDFAWIYDLKSHEKVWPNNQTDYERAGGGRKNFSVFQEVVLPAGEYQLNYTTDGSHSFDKWNVLPPNDPQFWGVSVWCDKVDMKNVSENTKEYTPVVDLTKMRDNAFKSQGFEVTKDMDIRVICLGEIADYEPNDYGWIVNAKSGEMVWKFSRSKSEYAGGGDKNRIVNEVISLNKGKYIAYFASDGSHSYRDWNVAPPHDQKLWGLSLWTINNSDGSSIKLFKEEEFVDENVIAVITKVRDNEREYKDFTMNSESKVRIYAIGEGDDGRMFDTGWIKNMDSGKIVWEMTYRISEHAGGAHKNRIFNDYVLLPKGNYRLYFECDGSHSFMDWNDDPPRDPVNYGIKILKD